MDEPSWVEGHRAAWAGLLANCLGELGYEATETKLASLVRERESALVQLRAICEEYGDNDWTPELNLADIIDKHLGRYLEARNPQPPAV